MNSDYFKYFFQFNKTSEPNQSLKNKRLANNFASLLQIGELAPNELARNSVININFFLSHRSEVLAMKEQVQMIRGLLAVLG